MQWYSRYLVKVVATVPGFLAALVIASQFLGFHDVLLIYRAVVPFGLLVVAFYFFLVSTGRSVRLLWGLVFLVLSPLSFLLPTLVLSNGVDVDASLDISPRSTSPFSARPCARRSGPGSPPWSRSHVES